jgi:hypothetical protein
LAFSFFAGGGSNRGLDSTFLDFFGVNECQRMKLLVSHRIQLQQGRSQSDETIMMCEVINQQLKGKAGIYLFINKLNGDK